MPNSKMQTWIYNKTWIDIIVRVPLVLFYFYLLYSYIKYPSYSSLIDNFNLLIHEAGHLLFSFFGEFISISGGTILQILAPLGTIYYFYQRQDMFAIGFAKAWLATSLFGVANYLDDADCICMDFYISFGGIDYEGSNHDWVYLLNKMNMFYLNNQITFSIRIVGYLMLISAIMWSIWLFFKIYLSLHKHSSAAKN